MLECANVWPGRQASDARLRPVCTESLVRQTRLRLGEGRREPHVLGEQCVLGRHSAGHRIGQVRVSDVSVTCQ